MFEYIAKCILALIVIAMMFILIRRLQSGISKNAVNQKTQRNITLVESITVGQDKSIAITKVGDKHYLIGISQQSVNLLTSLEDFEEVKQENNGQVMSFKDAFEKNCKALKNKLGFKGEDS